MIAINRKSLSNATKEEIVALVNAAESLNSDERKLLSNELHKRDEDDLILELNNKLSSDKVLRSTRIIKKHEDKIIDDFQKLFDEKIESKRIYAIIQKKYGLEDFEIKHTIEKEIKIGRRFVVSGFLFLILGVFSLLVAVYANNLGAYRFIFGPFNCVVGVIFISKGKFKSRLSKKI